MWPAQPRVSVCRAATPRGCRRWGIRADQILAVGRGASQGGWRQGPPQAGIHLPWGGCQHDRPPRECGQVRRQSWLPWACPVVSPEHRCPQVLSECGEPSAGWILNAPGLEAQDSPGSGGHLTMAVGGRRMVSPSGSGHLTPRTLCIIHTHQFPHSSPTLSQISWMWAETVPQDCTPVWGP